MRARETALHCRTHVQLMNGVLNLLAGMFDIFTRAMSGAATRKRGDETGHRNQQQQYFFHMSFT